MEAEIRMTDHALFSFTIQNPQILKTSHYIFKYCTITVMNSFNLTVHFDLFEELTTTKMISSKAVVSNKQFRIPNQRNVNFVL